MNIEKLRKKMRKAQEKQQNKFINKLLDSINWLFEKVNENNYESTSHKKEVFFQIIDIINNITNCF